MTDRDELATAFRSHFEGEPRFFRAPGRVNLIGEHTDYNDGFVMPAAIEYEARVAAAARTDSLIRFYAFDLDESAEFDLDAPTPARHHWSDYAFGVALTLRQAGHAIGGADIVMSSSVPFGSGLSSSAAFEVSVGYALLALSGLEIDPVELAKLCQKAENEYVGMRCGIMDQFISANGADGHALMLDCRSLETRLVPDRPPRPHRGCQFHGSSRPCRRRIQQAPHILRGRHRRSRAGSRQIHCRPARRHPRRT